MSWAMSDWEDLERSIEELGAWDKKTDDDCDDEDVDHPKPSKFLPPSFDGGEQHFDAPRPGSLFALILQEDSPTISGCAPPKMRRRGTVEERTIDGGDSTPDVFKVSDISSHRRKFYS